VRIFCLARGLFSGEAAPARLGSLRTVGSLDPVGPGFRRGDILVSHTGERRYKRARGERAKRATPRTACDRKASESEAADQATHEAGFAGRPGVAPRGQEAQADWGA